MANARIAYKTFEAANVLLDNRDFIGCKFVRCKLTYRGGQSPSFQQCDFQLNEFIFDGPAGNTLAFLQGISQRGSGLESVFKQLFPHLSIY